ncbi:hypothetical protein GCK72_017117 [Caenorhabditis remanei]|uniref:Uncharacterized protein n=1 Tax=Caenorhabditis remanei TaxID=31234 RepID=A0A6A5G6U1_CAERE|nr:hypothetical protein GCK72_017117 [Caenorhabditis remanei]KAF1750566.1 hypothetical protein GCK72_017117 [Caenorhabditis remanei]
MEQKGAELIKVCPSEIYIKFKKFINNSPFSSLQQGIQRRLHSIHTPIQLLQVPPTQFDSFHAVDSGKRQNCFSIGRRHVIPSGYCTTTPIC